MTLFHFVTPKKKKTAQYVRNFDIMCCSILDQSCGREYKRFAIKFYAICFIIEIKLTVLFANNSHQTTRQLRYEVFWCNKLIIASSKTILTFTSLRSLRIKEKRSGNNRNTSWLENNNINFYETKAHLGTVISNTRKFLQFQNFFWYSRNPES